MKIPNHIHIPSLHSEHSGHVSFLLKSVMVTPGLFRLSSERGKLGFFGLSESPSFTIDTIMLGSSPGVSNLFARFTFSPLFGK